MTELREEKELALDELGSTHDRARMARETGILWCGEIIRGDALQRDEPTVQAILRPVHHAGRAAPEKREPTVTPGDPRSRHLVVGGEVGMERTDLAGSRRLGRQGAHARTSLEY